MMEGSQLLCVAVLIRLRRCETYRPIILDDNVTEVMVLSVPQFHVLHGIERQTTFHVLLPTIGP
jgi:hypothetical protein